MARFQTPSSNSTRTRTQTKPYERPSATPKRQSDSKDETPSSSILSKVASLLSPARWKKHPNRNGSNGDSVNSVTLDDSTSNRIGLQKAVHSDPDVESTPGKNVDRESLSPNAKLAEFFKSKGNQSLSDIEVAGVMSLLRQRTSSSSSAADASIPPPQLHLAHSGEQQSTSWQEPKQSSPGIFSTPQPNPLPSTFSTQPRTTLAINRDNRRLYTPRSSPHLNRGSTLRSRRSLPFLSPRPRRNPLYPTVSTPFHSKRELVLIPSAEATRLRPLENDEAEKHSMGEIEVPRAKRSKLIGDRDAGDANSHTTTESVEAPAVEPSPHSISKTASTLLAMLGENDEQKTKELPSDENTSFKEFGNPYALTSPSSASRRHKPIVNNPERTAESPVKQLERSMPSELSSKNTPQKGVSKDIEPPSLTDMKTPNGGQDPRRRLSFGFVDRYKPSKSSNLREGISRSSITQTEKEKEEKEPEKPSQDATSKIPAFNFGANQDQLDISPSKPLYGPSGRSFNTVSTSSNPEAPSTTTPSMPLFQFGGRMSVEKPNTSASSQNGTTGHSKPEQTSFGFGSEPKPKEQEEPQSIDDYREKALHAEASELIPFSFDFIEQQNQTSHSDVAKQVLAATVSEVEAAGDEFVF